MNKFFIREIDTDFINERLDWMRISNESIPEITINKYKAGITLSLKEFKELCNVIWCGNYTNLGYKENKIYGIKKHEQLINWIDAWNLSLEELKAEYGYEPLISSQIFQFYYNPLDEIFLEEVTL